jgi:dTDP-4-dehydrorhamnose 3,5-epimerase
VDLREGSSTFLRWCALELSASNRTAVLIPPGFAHGYQTQTDDVELLYLHSTPYVPVADAGLNPYDETLGIKWPLPISVTSNKDSEFPMLTGQFRGLKV